MALHRHVVVRVPVRKVEQPVAVPTKVSDLEEVPVKKPVSVFIRKEHGWRKSENHVHVYTR